MQALVYKGKFEDLKAKRFLTSPKDPFVTCKVVQKGIGNGINILIYESGDIRTEINGLIFPGVKYIEDALKKMEIPYEIVEI